MIDLDSELANKSHHLDNFSDEAKRYMRSSFAENTKINYMHDLNIFKKWCEINQCVAIPASPSTIANFMVDQLKNKLKPSTIERRLAAIRLAHESCGLISPTMHRGVKSVMKGIKRTHSVAVNKKTPITADHIKKMSDCCGDDIVGLRDRAILLIGFAGAFRRSELVALKLDDIERTTEGIKITVRRSKMDQEGKGQVIAIPRGKSLKVIEALENWLKIGHIQDEYIFRRISKAKRVLSYGLCSKTVANVIKKYASIAGFENISEFSGHSLRSGFLTTAAQHGANVYKLMEVSRHASFQSTTEYIHAANLFHEHAGDKFL